MTKSSTPQLQEELEGMVATVDTGARNLSSWAGWILASISLVWSLFSALDRFTFSVHAGRFNTPFE